MQLAALVYVTGTDRDNYLNEFNCLIALLAVQNMDVSDNEKKYLLIRSLLESMSVISTIARPQGCMTIDEFDALIRAEFDCKKNLHNKLGNSKHLMTESTAQQLGLNSNNGINKKKSKLHFCGNKGHFTRSIWSKFDITGTAME